MSVSQPNVIDFIGDEPDAPVSYLGIADHLPWGLEQPDHLEMLQQKLNSYIEFIETGQVYEGRDHLRDRRLQIRVFGQYPLDSRALQFYREANAALKDSQIELVFHLRDDLA